MDGELRRDWLDRWFDVDGDTDHGVTRQNRRQRKMSIDEHGEDARARALY